LEGGHGRHTGMIVSLAGSHYRITRAVPYSKKGSPYLKAPVVDI